MVEPPCCGDALRLTIILKFFVFCIFKGFWKYKLQFKKVFKKERRRKGKEKEEKKREKREKKGGEYKSRIIKLLFIFSPFFYLPVLDKNGAR